jgi:hypothetical protein
MRRILLSLPIACLCAFSAFAQSLPTSPPEAKPEVAYRLFSKWADNYQVEALRGKTIAQSVLFSAGALSLGGSALVWYGGDEISREATGAPMDADLRQNLAIGLGIGGGALLISGLIVRSLPIKDYRAIYADIFDEKDPEVREAMAVSVLRYQADRGKESRIISFVSGFVVPIIAGGIKAGTNLAQGENWSKDVLSSMGSSSWWMAGSIVSLFQKTPEERLYERYLSTRDALYGANR